MTDEKKQQQMHDAVDAALSPDAYRKLMNDMKADEESAAQFEQLKSVDGMLREAKTSPMPGRLAENIMARIAKKESLPDAQPLKSARALAWGLGLMAGVTLPLLLLLTLLIVSGLGTGAALSGALLGLVGIATGMYAALTGLVSFAGQLIAQYPFIFAGLLLIPLAAFGLWRLGSGARQ